MKKKLAIWGTGALAFVLVGYVLVFRNTTPAYSYRFDKVSKGSVAVVVTATGTVNPVVSVEVGTQVSGIISKLYADYNSIVKEGQVIAQIDPTFLQQAVHDAEANVDRARAQLEQSRRAYQRTRDLFQRGLESQANYDVAYTSYLSDSASAKSSKATLDRAKINLAYATIYAPINGVVINRAVNVGQTVAASFSSPTLYTIANDLHKMQVQTVVDESDIGAVAIGQEATFTVDAYPNQRFTGTVSKIWLVPQTVQNVVNYTVIIDVNNDQLKLMPGMTANVKIEVASKPEALRVPNMALRFQPPADLIDSTEIQAQRNGPSGGGNDRSGAGRGGMRGSPEGRQRFQALRDSILAAHGGQMNPEDLQSEVRAAFQRMNGDQQAMQEQKIVLPSRTRNATKFGVTQTFPEYEKSGSDAAQQSGRGRVWMLNSKGKFVSVLVRTGLNDGRFTEVSSPTLKEGDQIVLGMVSNNSENGESQMRNPLSGQGQGQRGPMGGFR